MDGLYLLEFSRSLETFRWTKVSVNLPTPIAFHSAEYFKNSKRLIIVGGLFLNAEKRWERTSILELITISLEHLSVGVLKVKTHEDSLYLSACRTHKIEQTNEIIFCGGFSSQFAEKGRAENIPSELWGSFKIDEKKKEVKLTTKQIGFGFSFPFFFFPNKTTIFLSCGTVS